MKTQQETFQKAVTQFNREWPTDLKPLVGKISKEDALYIFVQGFYAGRIYTLTEGPEEMK